MRRPPTTSRPPLLPQRTRPAPTRTHSLEAMQLDQRPLVHHQGALQGAVEGLGHQRPCPLGQRWAQQPREPALSGLCGERVRAASWVRVWSPPGPRRKDPGQGLTFQHLLKLSQQGFLGDCGTGGSGGSGRPRRPRGAREASLRHGRRESGSQWEPQPPLPWVQTPGLTDFLSRPRHRFLEAPSCGRRMKFSQVMWASENSDPKPSGGCRARGQS